MTAAILTLGGVALAVFSLRPGGTPAGILAGSIIIALGVLTGIMETVV